MNRSSDLSRGRRLGGWCPGLILATQAGLLAGIACSHTPSTDELGHMVAGISRWHFGRFDIFCVNPPLVSAIATIPVVFDHPRTDWTDWEQMERPEWSLGRRFVEANGLRSLWYFALARLACIPLALLGSYVCYRWASDLWGRRSGLISATLWAFSPNVLTSGAQLLPDAGAAALGVLAHYAFWRWLVTGGWRKALLAGITLGLAELTKLTWIMLFGLWPILWIAWTCLGGSGSYGARLRQTAAQMVVILLVGLYVLNAGYGFEGTGRRLDRFAFLSDALSGRDSPSVYSGNRFAGTWAGALPLPLPANYLRGVDLQKVDFERKMWSYLRGENRLGGWWYFYFYALAVKEPLGTFGLAALAIGLLLRDPSSYAAPRRDELVLLLPPVALLALVSSQTGFSHHLRYVLPALPYFYIAIGRVGRAVDERRLIVTCLVSLALVGSIVGSLAVYPHCQSYFNELAGGPLRGHDHLIGTSIDSGQDLLFLKRWADEHPEARPLYLDAHGPLDPGHVAIPACQPPPSRGPGWYAISVHRLREHDSKYGDFLTRQPIAMAGYSIYIYRIDPTESRSGDVGPGCMTEPLQ